MFPVSYAGLMLSIMTASDESFSCLLLKIEITWRCELHFDINFLSHFKINSVVEFVLSYAKLPQSLLTMHLPQ